MASKILFTSVISPESVKKLYMQLGISLPGKVAVKVHSGEPGNQNFLKPEYWKPTVELVGGTVVECNTAYEGGRHNTRVHRETLARHGWSGTFAVDLLDAEGPDWELPVPGGKVIQKNFVGKDLKNYDSLLVLSHFKGHPMGGFGGALKQLSIGMASSYGKKFIHGGGDAERSFDGEHNAFIEAMADAASSVTRLFPGKAVYINVMKNMSVDCDCCAVAEDPKIRDIGILASTDPVAIDRACVDLVYASADPGKAALIERMESLNGAHILECAEALGIGSQDYELEAID